MNERIKELAIDCAGQMEWDAPKNLESFTFNRDELQKFAELIVRDCAEQAGDCYCGNDVKSSILNRFGVIEAMNEHCKGCKHHHNAGHPKESNLANTYNNWCVKFSRCANKAVGECKLKDGKST